MEHLLIKIAGLATALTTAYFCWRDMFLPFWNAPEVDPLIGEHPTGATDHRIDYHLHSQELDDPLNGAYPDFDYLIDPEEDSEGYNNIITFHNNQNSPK